MVDRNAQTGTCESPSPHKTFFHVTLTRSGSRVCYPSATSEGVAATVPLPSTFSTPKRKQVTGSLTGSVRNSQRMSRWRCWQSLCPLVFRWRKTPN